MTPWHKQTAAEAIQALHSGERGLTGEEAAKRLAEHGENILPEGKADNFFIIFLRQFKSPLIYLLFGAGAAILALGDAADAIIIFFVLVFNSLIGAYQEGRAENTLRALRRFSETKAVVFRDGVEDIIPDKNVVEGDVIILSLGEKVPADARILSANNLKANEAALTGESEPSHKIPDALLIDGPNPADQKNMVFKGTNIASGSGRALVVATGTRTVIGGIAEKIGTIDQEMPLQKNIAYLSKWIIAVVLAISALLFALGIFAGESAKDMIIVAISLAVSVIPEGLPIVVTLVLATGVYRMGKKNALVKKLQAVEALGQAKVIAVDKTGTITKNELTVRKIYTDGKMFDIGGSGYEPKGDVRLDGTEIDAVNHPELIYAGKIAGFCADAKVAFNEETKEWEVAGDPTEAALLVLAQKLGFHKEELEKESPLVAEIPFDYVTKYHATVHAEDGKKLLAVVGAPEVILSLSSKVRRGGKSVELERSAREELEMAGREMSHEGLRTLAFAVMQDPAVEIEPKSLRDLTFTGFFGMKDSLRPEAALSVSRAVSAGIGVVMITGDHALTAVSIAKEAGIYREGDNVLVGGDIETMSEEELSRALPGTTVFARVTPEHKLKIVTAYKQRGLIIGMTGDGVNDAPPLVAADLGLAMGKAGTEVAKEAADIILLDDNFASVVNAVEEGRNIYKTIRKVILYLFSTGAGEVFTIVGAVLLGLPLPLLAAQIIWLNFVSDSFLDIALAMDPKEEGLLKRKFSHPSKFIVDKLMTIRMVVMALPMAAGTLYLFSEYIAGGADMAKAGTIALTTLAVFQWFNVWNCRSEEKSVFRTNPFSNPYLVLAIGIVICLQLFAVYHPLGNALLHTTPLALSEWLVIIPLAATIIIAEEIRKLIMAAARKTRVAL